MCRQKEAFLSDFLAVTNRKLCSRPFLEQIERICIRHPAGVILREKDLTEREYAFLAEKVQEITRHYQVPCIYHTWVEAAYEAGAEGIHLSFANLKKWAGSPLLESFPKTGVSIHAVEEAREAQRMGASYLTAGHIYATDCKKGLKPRGTDFLREVCRAVSIPVYAIGGIREDEKQMEEMKSCGAKGACMMSYMMKI